MLTHCKSTLRLNLCRSPSRGFDARRFFLANGLLPLRLQLRCSRRFDTSGFLTSCQQTLLLQLCRSPSRGLDVSRYFLARGVLPLRLQSYCSQLRGLLAFSLRSRSLDACRFFAKVALPFRGLNARHLQLIRLFGQCSGSLPNVLADSLTC